MIKPNVQQMLEVGKGCGLDTVGEAYTNYLNHYTMFFCIPEFEEQQEQFNLELEANELTSEEELITEALNRLLL